MFPAFIVMDVQSHVVLMVLREVAGECRENMWRHWISSETLAEDELDGFKRPRGWNLTRLETSAADSLIFIIFKISWHSAKLFWHINRIGRFVLNPFASLLTVSRCRGTQRKYLITKQRVTLSYLISSFIVGIERKIPIRTICLVLVRSWRGLKAATDAQTRFFFARHLKEISRMFS